MNVLSWSILPCSSCLPEVRSLAFFLTARHTIRSRLFGCSLTPRINTIPIYPISTPGRDNMSIVGFRENKYKKKNTESWLQRAPALQRWRAERGKLARQQCIPFSCNPDPSLGPREGGQGRRQRFHGCKRGDGTCRRRRHVGFHSSSAMPVTNTNQGRPLLSKEQQHHSPFQGIDPAQARRSLRSSYVAYIIIHTHAKP